MISMILDVWVRKYIYRTHTLSTHLLCSSENCCNIMYWNQFLLVNFKLISWRKDFVTIDSYLVASIWWQFQMFWAVWEKMMVKRLLKLYSASKGTISIQSYLEKFNDLQPGKICTQFLKAFPYDAIDTLCVEVDDLSHLLLVCGYVARKTMEKSECSSCKAMFGGL